MGATAAVMMGMKSAAVRLAPRPREREIEASEFIAAVYVSQWAPVPS